MIPPRCPVCGGELHDQIAGCSRCPLNSGCDMLCCENCGYETVAPRSVVVDMVTGLFRRRRTANGPSRTS